MSEKTEGVGRLNVATPGWEDDSEPTPEEHEAEIEAANSATLKEYFARRRLSKHAQHDQKTHGNWAHGGAGASGGKSGHWTPGEMPKGFNDLGKESWAKGLKLLEEHPGMFNTKIFDEDGLPAKEEPGLVFDYPGRAELDPGYDANTIAREIREQWEAEVARAITMNEIDAGTEFMSEYNAERGDKEKGSPAFERWGYKSHPEQGNWAPLPDEVYHVTTAIDAVVEGGLKTRSELENTAGLGGGTDAAISFTTDREVVDAIVQGLHEARRVVRNEDGGAIDWMRSEAEKGGYWDQVSSSMKNVNGYTYEEATTPEQRMEAYKNFTYYRQFNGGPMDPLFFNVKAENIANIDPSQIGVVTAKPAVEGAKGWQLGGMREWRVATGAAVEITSAEVRDGDGDGRIWDDTDKERAVTKNDGIDWIAKHYGGGHDQKSHGNWASGRSSLAPALAQFTRGAGKLPGKRLAKTADGWAEEDVRIEIEPSLDVPRSDEIVDLPNGNYIMFEQEYNADGEWVADHFDSAPSQLIDAEGTERVIREALNEISPELRPAAVVVGGGVEWDGRATPGGPPIGGAHYTWNNDTITIHPTTLGLSEDVWNNLPGEWHESGYGYGDLTTLRKLVLHEAAHGIDDKIHERMQKKGPGSWRSTRHRLAQTWFQQNFRDLDPEGETTWYLHQHFNRVNDWSVHAPAELIAEHISFSMTGKSIPGAALINETLASLDLSDVLVDGDGDGYVLDNTDQERIA